MRSDTVWHAMHAYEVAEDDEADEAEVGDEEVPAEEALVAATLYGDTSSDEPSFDGDADMRADVDENVWHSLPRDSLCAVIRVPLRFAGDTGAAKLTCGKWRVQSASIHCGSFGPINWHHVACGDCLYVTWPKHTYRKQLKIKRQCANWKPYFESNVHTHLRGAPQSQSVCGNRQRTHGDSAPYESRIGCEAIHAPRQVEQGSD